MLRIHTEQQQTTCFYISLGLSWQEIEDLRIRGLHDLDAVRSSLYALEEILRCTKASD